MTWTTTGEIVTAAKLNEVFPHGDNAWTTWTPTLTNLNVGTSGVTVARYIQIGGAVHAHFRATLGGTGISVGDVQVSLPVTMGVAQNLEPLGPCLLRDTGTASFSGVIEGVNTTTVTFREHNVSGSLIVTAALSSTSPFTWVAGDILAFNITYEAA